MGWTKSIWWKAWILTSLEWIQESCVFYQLYDVMSTGFSKPLLTRQVISNSVDRRFLFRSGVAAFWTHASTTRLRAAIRAECC